MPRNNSLQKAAKAQQDEFYTDVHDIEHELMYYKNHFRDKVIFCNCDDPYESEFFKYFAMSFNAYGLKKLISTCYAGSPIAQQQLMLFEPNIPPRQRKPYCAIIESLEDYNGDGRKDLLDIEHVLTHNEGGQLRILKGNGDFRSPECIDLLKESDLVVTNPPHSLLREFIALMFEYGKKFLILGNQNAITYKEVFPLLMQNKMWLGLHNGDMSFRVPDNYEPRETRYWEEEDKNGKIQKFRSLGNMCWLTNLEHGRMNETLFLYRSYEKNPEAYPKYDNYDAIEVSKVSDIPCDYPGVMGVPVTFMDKYNPKQFEILGLAKRGLGVPALRTKIYTKEDYPNYSDLNAGTVIKDKDGRLRVTYARILIRRIGGTE